MATDESGAELPEEQTPQGRAARGETFSTELLAADSKGVTRRYEATGHPVSDSRKGGGVIVFRQIAEADISVGPS